TTGVTTPAQKPDRPPPSGPVAGAGSCAGGSCPTGSPATSGSVAGCREGRSKEWYRPVPERPRAAPDTLRSKPGNHSNAGQRAGDRYPPTGYGRKPAVSAGIGYRSRVGLAWDTDQLNLHWSAGRQWMKAHWLIKPAC